MFSFIFFSLLAIITKFILAINEWALLSDVFWAIFWSVGLDDWPPELPIIASNIYHTFFVEDKVFVCTG